MKNTRRISAFVASVLAVACMAAPMTQFTAEAKDVYVTSTDNATHTYTAYQIFTGTYNADNGLTVTGWGTGIDSAALLEDTAFKGLQLNDDNDASTTDTMSGFIGAKKDAATIAQAFEKVKNPSALSEVLAKYRKGDGTALSQTSENPTTLDVGYYIVVDSYTVNTSTPTNDALSEFILKVSDNTTDALEITTKKSIPSVVKKVEENTDVVDYTYTDTNGTQTDANYNDVADYCMGDAVSFKLYGTIPSTIDSYTNGYKYVFHDTLASQFTPPLESDVTVKIDGVAAVGAVVDVTGNEITVTFDNIKKGNTVKATSIVTVEYDAVLNQNAYIGQPGQQNVVDLEYSNNPEWDGTGTPTTDFTPEDKVIVFTYELDTTKQDAATQKKLAGAKFKLANALTGGNYAKLTPVFANEGDTTTDTYKFNGWDTEGTGTEITTLESGVFKIQGLDEGTYYMEETEAPDTYNKIADRIALTITANTLDGAVVTDPVENRQAWNGVAESALNKLELSVGGATASGNTDGTTYGVVAHTVNNSKGTSLPSTGGIGTTIFYVGGGILAVGAGVLLVSKKRMSNK